MKNNIMNIAIVQPDIRWKESATNLLKYSEMLNRLTSPVDLVLLPEMFTTGFCTEPFDIAEEMDGDSVRWMKETAKLLNSAIAGSLIIRQDGLYYNRLVIATPENTVQWYDKRHLFRIAGEEEHFTGGSERLIIRLGEWRVAFQICYDLRFPVWARNRNDYDLLVYAANWPEARNDVWNTLLRARAMENLCYVGGVNRVGVDGNGISYSGESMLVDAKGNVCGTFGPSEEAVKTFTISLDELHEFRTKFPVWKDWDKFSLGV
jgi:omega-amidase